MGAAVPGRRKGYRLVGRCSFSQIRCWTPGLLQVRTMERDCIASSHGRSGSLAALSEHCDESAWKDASAWTAVAFWDVASHCCVLRQPRRCEDTHPTPGFQPDKRFGCAASRKFWDVGALFRSLYLTAAQSMSTLSLGNRLHVRSCVPDFSKPFHSFFLWFFELTD